MAILIFLYLLGLAFIFCYSLIQLHLVFLFIKYKLKSKNTENQLVILNENLPFVTIQLPIYNELYVVERLLDAISNVQYPQHKLEIQILDDSTDETTQLITQKLAKLKHLNLDFQHIRRANRTGFKAGALAYGLQTAKGEFIAIFDADFVPQPNFLLKTLPFFDNNRVGVVQTRWKYINENYSLLTRLQAIMLDAHFFIEQFGRNRGGFFINFNGTAGVWRKSCIQDSGGWQADTLTEDLDLSYRAQLKGWKFIYLDNIQTPSELPITMQALKNQQFRWTKGAAECARKNLGSVLNSPNLPFGTKLHAAAHLLNTGTFLAAMLLSMCSVPIAFLIPMYPEYASVLVLGVYLGISLYIIILFFLISFLYKRGATLANLGRFILQFPFFLALSCGLTLHNSLAVLEGYIGKKTPFVRTPKFNVQADLSNHWKQNNYMSNRVSKLIWAEIFLCLYFAFGVAIDISLANWRTLPFHFLFSFGYAMVVYLEIAHHYFQSKIPQKTLQNPSNQSIINP